MSDQQPRSNGFLRRVAILALIAVVYTRFILEDPYFTPPERIPLLRICLYGALAWGVITMLADRLGRSK